MEEFYAADASAQENNEPPRMGLSALLDHERATLQRFKRIEARCAGPILARQTWRGDKLASERFYYDPGQMRP